MSGGSARPFTRASDRKRSNNSPFFTGSTAVIAETEGDRRVGRAAAPLAENVLVPREAHRVGHDEKEAGETQARPISVSS